MKKKLRSHLACTIDELKDKLQGIWHPFIASECRSFVDTMMHCIGAVLRNKGGVMQW